MFLLIDPMLAKIFIPKLLLDCDDRWTGCCHGSWTDAVPWVLTFCHWTLTRASIRFCASTQLIFTKVGRPGGDNRLVCSSRNSIQLPMRFILVAKAEWLVGASGCALFGRGQHVAW